MLFFLNDAPSTNFCQRLKFAFFLPQLKNLFSRFGKLDSVSRDRESKNWNLLSKILFRFNDEIYWLLIEIYVQTRRDGGYVIHSGNSKIRAQKGAAYTCLIFRNAIMARFKMNRSFCPFLSRKWKTWWYLWPAWLSKNCFPLNFLLVMIMSPNRENDGDYFGDQFLNEYEWRRYLWQVYHRALMKHYFYSRFFLRKQSIQRITERFCGVSMISKLFWFEFSSPFCPLEYLLDLSICLHSFLRSSSCSSLI